MSKVKLQDKREPWRLYAFDVWEWMCDTYALNATFRTQDIYLAPALKDLKHKSRQDYVSKMIKYWLATSPHFEKVAQGKYRLPSGKN